MTTIYVLLVLDSLKAIIEMSRKQPFSIEYETRDGNFLKNIDCIRADENIDFHHISKARDAIKDWLHNRDGSHALKLMQHLLADDEADRNVRVIWYELAPGDDPVAAFTRLNVGKIPLTDAELVRALFLRCASLDGNGNRLSLRIAYEWDQIEKRLQNDAFWYFLQSQDTGGSSRISLIFRLAAQKTGKAVNGEDYGVFFCFAELLKSSLSTENEWQKVKSIFMVLEEWYEDRDLFHVLGFILHQKEGDLNEIIALLTESLSLGKEAFSQCLRSRVCRLVLEQDLNAYSPRELREEISNLCQTISYRNRKKVRSLLLLFNLATLLEVPRSNIRFQFESFKRESWDIEHIRSVSDNRPDQSTAQKEWLRHCLKFLRASNEEAEQRLAVRIETYLDPEIEPENQITFEKIDGEILTHFRETQDAPDNDLANLTLLNSRINRGYRNAVFAVKRDILLSHDRSGIFVPLCTRNVFLKCYSRFVGNSIFWMKEDARDYVNAIEETLARFFIGSGES